MKSKKGLKERSWTRDIGMTSEPRWITIKACARDILGIHPMTAYKWFYAGRLPGIRIGRTIRIDLRKLEAHLEQKSHSPGKLP